MCYVRYLLFWFMKVIFVASTDLGFELKVLFLTVISLKSNTV